MGLFDIFKPKKPDKIDVKISKPKDKNQNSFGEDITHLTASGELPWGWIAANRDFTERIDAELLHFFEEAYKAKKEGIKAEYAALKSLLTYREAVQRLCAQKGECFAEWATISVAIPLNMAHEKERLQYLEENMAMLLKKEAKVEQIKSELPEIIRAEPGVIQSDLYKRYDASLKGSISNELYQMETQGLIVREKSGRSYKLYINDKQGRG